MNAYERAVGALERLDRFGIHPSLDGVRAVCGALGSPQDALRVVQVTGTNGKTSVARMTAALLGEHGDRVGVYTSPHLLDWTERVEVGGVPVAREAFGVAVLEAVDAARGLGFAVGEGATADGPRFTQFEALTCAALLVLRDTGVSWAVLEVGMGGRWDATSVATPEVAIVTGVGLDHAEWLGDTVEAIASEKAQVVRAGSVAVLGPGTLETDAVFAARASEVGARTVRVREDGGDVSLRVTRRPAAPGDTTALSVRTVRAVYGLEVRGPAYQAPNAAVAVSAVEEALGRALDEARMREALGAMRFPGRFELLATDPPLVVDGAHNPAAAAVLAGAVRDAWPDARPVALLGALEDKDVLGVVETLAPVVAGFVATSSGVPRAMSAADVAHVVERATGLRPAACEELGDALQEARALGGAAGVLATGSLTVVAGVMTALQGA